MTKITRSLMPVAFAGLSLFTFSAVAAENAPVDMTAYLCKDIMRMSDNERSISMAVLHGHRLGKQGKTSFNSDELAKISNDFIEHCLDNPHDKAMASFEKLAK